MKLNIGSNDVRLDGYTNLDMRDGQHVDIVDDAATLATVADGSCEAITAHNILEHFPYDQTAAVLACWVRKLKPAGIISIGVPDAELVFARWMRGECTRAKYRGDQWLDAQHSFFGNLDLLRSWHGDAAAMYGHQALFSEGSLRELMASAGLSDIVKVKPNHSDNVTLDGRLADG